MDNHGISLKAQVPLKGDNVLFQNLVFIVKIRNIRHDEVQIDRPSVRMGRLRSDVTNNLCEPSEVLGIWKEQYHYGVGKLPRADASDVGVASARVDQYIVRVDDCVPLLLEIFEEKIAVVVLIEGAPINLGERVRVAILVGSGRHDPETAVVESDTGGLEDKFPNMGCLSGGEVRVDEVDDAKRGGGRPTDVERVEAWGFEVEVHRKNATAPLGKFDGDVDECHRSPDAALERVEGGDVH